MRLQAEARARNREEKRKAKTPLPATARVSTPKQRDEVHDLDTLFRRQLFGVLTDCLPRLRALLTSEDDKIAADTWKTALQHGLLPRQAGMAGGGAGGTKIVFNFPDGDTPIDVTPHG